MILAAILLSRAALGQTPVLEEVLVTASKRTENVQDIAMAVTAFTDQVIQEAGINNADDLATMTPSLTITTNTQPYTAAFRIRGIGTSQTDSALEPSVGLFVDDVYMNRSGLGMSDLTDIERIEVLHGPQGTLYGKNTNAGAISIHTKNPNLEAYEGYLEATLGNYDLQKFILAASGPIADQLAFRVSGTVHERDGYFDNSAGQDFNGADDWNVIAKLLWQPTESLSILLNGSHVERDTHCCAADAVQSDPVNDELAARGLPVDQNDPFDFDVATDVDTEFTNEASNLSITIDYDREWGSIKSITAWGEAEGMSSYDPDRSQLDVMSYVDGHSEGDRISQEIRFTSNIDEWMDYQLGLFYFESTTDAGDGKPFVFLGADFISQGNQQEDFLAALPGGISNVALIGQPGDWLRANSRLDTETIALFGQSTWHLSNQWRVTGGLRWTDEEKDADLLTEVSSTALSAQLTGLSFLTFVSMPIDQRFSRDSSDVDWLVSTSVDVLDDTMLYASIATGSKSGGFNTVNGTPEQREFDDESTITYELGVKSTLLQSRLRVNAAVFYTEIDDFQYQQQLDIGIGTRVTNLGEVETSGVDVEIQALPLPNLTLGAGLLYMHTYEIIDGPQDGADLPFTAEYSGTLSATLVFPLADGGIYLRSDYSYMDDHLTTASVDFEDRDIQDRHQLNAKLGWRNDHWDISVWGKNLTDDEYGGLTAATFPITDMDAWFLAPPRTWGGTLRYDF